MWSIFTFLAPALPAQAAQTGGLAGVLNALMPLIFVVVIFYWIAIRPAQKKQREHDELLKALKKGDKVVTNGGIYGKVTKIDDSIAVLEVSDNTKIRVARRAIAGFEGEAEPPPAQP